MQAPFVKSQEIVEEIIVIQRVDERPVSGLLVCSLLGGEASVDDQLCACDVGCLV